MDNEALPIGDHQKSSALHPAFKLINASQPGESVAGVVVRHGLNPNLVQKWRKGQQTDCTGVPSACRHHLPQQIPLSVTIEAPTTHPMEVPDTSGQLVALACQSTDGVDRLVSADAVTPSHIDRSFALTRSDPGNPDMRSGPETTLARVVKAGAANRTALHVFANKRANRVKCWCVMASGWLRGDCTRAALFDPAQIR